jgi:protein O-GlcNAc transferase
MPDMDNMVWRLLHANGVNRHWGEIEHYHNFSRKRLYALLEKHGFRPVEYTSANAAASAWKSSPSKTRTQK